MEIKEIKYLKKYGIIGGKQLHNGWSEKFNSERFPMGIFGKWQYKFTSSKGTVSLVKLLDLYQIGEHVYEIYCLEGELFSDVRRFFKREDAIKEIIKLLKKGK